MCSKSTALISEGKRFCGGGFVEVKWQTFSAS
jgi:hypothetical protein